MANYTKADFLDWIQNGTLDSNFDSIATGDFQKDEIAELVKCLKDAQSIVDNISGYSDLSTAISTLKTAAVTNAFDKTTDDDEDLPVAGSFSNFSGSDLRDILNSIDSALGGKSESDTTVSTGITYDNTDVSSITTADDVHEALDEIYGTLGTNDPANDFDSTYNYLEGKSSILAALNTLDSEIKNNYRHISGVEGDIAYRETLWNQNSATSLTEHTTSNTSDQDLRYINFWKGNTDDTIFVRFRGKANASNPVGYVEGSVSGESLSSGRYVMDTDDAYDNYDFDIDISGLDNGLYTLELTYKSMSGNSITITSFNVIKKG